VICDSPAGIETEVTMAMRHADVAVVVNPEVSSIRDADRIIGMLDAKTVRAEQGHHIEKHHLLTRYDPVRARRGEIMTVENVIEILSIPLGIIPESGEVLRSSNVVAPVTLGSPTSAPAQAYLEAARRLNGESTLVTQNDKPRLFHRLFTRRAA
jgi:septum site-determining protein MinD